MSTVTTQVEETIQKEVSRFDPFEARISELKEKYSGLTITDIEDKENYELVRVAISELRSIRTGTEKDKKEIKAPFLAACSTIEEKAKWIIAEVKKIEDPLQKRKDEIDEEREKEKAEKKRKQDAALFQRQLQLTKMGAQFDGTNFVLEGVEVNMALVREVDEETYNTQILSQFKEIFDRNEKIRIEEEEKKKAADLLLKQQQEALEKQQAELKERQDALDKQQREIEQRQKEEAEKILRSRMNTLTVAGMKYNPNNNTFFYDELLESLEDIKNDTESGFEARYKILKEGINKREKEKAEARLKKQEDDKQAAITAALEKQKKDQESADAAKKEQEKLDNLRKEEELAQSSDKVKWEAILSLLPTDAALKEISFKSPKYRKKIAMFIEKIEEIKNL